MEETGRSSRFDRETRDLATEIFVWMYDYIEAKLNIGFEWQILGGPQRSRHMTSCLYRLASGGSDHIEQPMISGIVLRCIREGNIDTWNLERIWDNVDINGIGDHELHALNYNVPGDVRLGMATNINVV